MLIIVTLQQNVLQHIYFEIKSQNIKNEGRIFLN